MPGYTCYIHAHRLKFFHIQLHSSIPCFVQFEIKLLLILIDVINTTSLAATCNASVASNYTTNMIAVIGEAAVCMTVLPKL